MFNGTHELRQKVEAVTGRTIDPGEPMDKCINELVDKFNEEPIDRGVYCEACGYFEGVPDMVDAICKGCGCQEEEHIEVKVVRA